jgi:hypothetical protein
MAWDRAALRGSSKGGRRHPDERGGLVGGEKLSGVLIPRFVELFTDRVGDQVPEVVPGRGVTLI